ncbi:MAG: peptidyl-prolyl cis-trans isomerase [Rhizobacter sp.]|nr:peptidyl-prolyl cis-trans isomerase [Rhizobacter sp.]
MLDSIATSCGYAAASPPVRRFARLSLGVAMCAAAAACGGGDDNDLLNFANVTTAKLGVAKFTQKLVLTLTGQKLGQDLLVTSSNCDGIARSSTAPYISTDAISYYTCTLTQLGAGTVSVLRVSDNVPMAALDFTVPTPAVTLSVSQSGIAKADIVVTLDPTKAPITVSNFLAYVNAGFYDGTVFHRALVNMVAQGGGFTLAADNTTLTQKTTGLRAPIALEVGNGLSNVQWTIAMARTSDPASATSQFFLNVVNNAAAFDPSSSTAGYAVFGSITSGTATAAALAAACSSPVTGAECVPSPVLTITKALQSS